MTSPAASDGEAGAGSQSPDPDAWDADDVRRLRGYLGESQAGLAARLGTRQQTISEWETGMSRPRRMSRRLLRLVAEGSGFYDAAPSAPSARSPEPPERPAAPADGGPGGPADAPPGDAP